MYNRYFCRHTKNTTKHPFKLPTNFTAPLPDNSNLQEYISNVYHDLKSEHNSKFLTADSHARTPHLYLLLKIHKQDNPGRPIISGCEGPTVKLSQYADHLLKPLLNHIPSYVQDTTDFLRRIFTFNKNLPKNIILITIYVRSLYTNIPNDQGIQACIDKLKESNTLTPESEQSIINV
jgi:hypothetical protein